MESKPFVALIEETIEETDNNLTYTKFTLNENNQTQPKFPKNFSSNELFESEKTIRNLREKTAILLELLKPGFKISYSFPPRPKFEVFGGYKIAQKRQASIKAKFSDVKIYNLYFRFSSQGLENLNTSAMMYRKGSEEVILLSPQDTELQIQQEKEFYISASKSMIVQPKGMSVDIQSELLENLNQLSTKERCAQSLQHEFGHILHWRIFNLLGLREPHQIYEWFYKHGYAHLLDRRSPEFAATPDPHLKIYLLKESLVEDYRIWLNIKEVNGMFILPNVNTYYGDFFQPTLLEEGVELMKKMLSNMIGNTITTDTTEKFSGEPNRVLRGKEIYDKALSTKWEPGSNLMSEQDHLDIITALKQSTLQTV